MLFLGAIVLNMLSIPIAPNSTMGIIAYEAKRNGSMPRLNTLFRVRRNPIVNVEMRAIVPRFDFLLCSSQVVIPQGARRRNGPSGDARVFASE